MHRDNIQIGFSDFGSSEIIEGDFYDLDSLNCYIVITDENKLTDLPYYKQKNCEKYRIMLTDLDLLRKIC